ncbi:MAG: hypothetical protein LBE08_02185, partial [Bifidobacteriaceae bacterium]|nr:hypothetical protein [Bifidobacteriaceae bacterium]
MRKTPLAYLAAVCAALALAGCGDQVGEQGKTGQPYDDDGTVPAQLLPAPSGDDAVVEGLDEPLQVAAEPASGWLSAPWALAGPLDEASTEAAIIYVAGDAGCYAHAGFTLDESGSKVTIGSYTAEVPEATDCPANPAGAFKWGTIKLGQPLGERALV